MKRSLLLLAIVALLAVVLILSRRSRAPTLVGSRVPAAPSRQPSEPAVPAGQATDARVDLTRAPEPAAEPTPPPAPAASAKPVDFAVGILQQRLKDFDSNRSWETADALLQSVIQVEWDANGRFEDVTDKWDEIDPTNGHKLRKIPRYDPEAGFLDILDPRGSRWYRFTRADFPEWWELRYPDGTTETGKQDGFAMPRKIADDLAQAIRARAAGLLEKHVNR